MDQLVVIALYPAQDEITKGLFDSIAASECEHVEVDLAATGTDYKTVTLTLRGSWNQLTRFKNRFALIQQQHPITAIIKEAQTAPYATQSLPYQAYITTFAHPKALEHLTQFLLNLSIHIHTFSVTTYQAPITQTAMFDISLTFVLPSDQSISDYRESILQFCDENNFEIVLESKRA